MLYKSINTSKPLIRCVTACAVMFLCTGRVFYARAGQPIPGGSDLAEIWSHPRSPVAETISAFARPGEALGTWGWASHLHAECRMRQATRRLTTLAEIDTTPFTNFYRTVYLSDLQNSQPPVFVDTTGQKNIPYKDWLYSVDACFPALAKYIQAHYQLVSEQNGSRVYVRNDRFDAQTARQ